MPANGILVGKELFHEGLVDDGDELGGCGVAVGESAAPDDRLAVKGLDGLVLIDIENQAQKDAGQAPFKALIG